MKRTFAAALFALSIVTAPAAAATVDYLNADLNLMVLPLNGTVHQLQGNITLISNGNNQKYGPYEFLGSDFTLDGNPLSFAPVPGPNENFLFFWGPNNTLPLYTLSINFADVGNLVIPGTNFTTPGAFAFGLGVPPIGPADGDITILSETISAVTLPSALPLFGTALAGLGGVG
jgi:hypothetical protein